MSDKELSEKLLELLGGKGNVTSNAACMTRLRVGCAMRPRSMWRASRRLTA